MIFVDLLLGDMFNTKEARWVKISPTEAICVLSTIHRVGHIKGFPGEQTVILLYSSLWGVNQ